CQAAGEAADGGLQLGEGHRLGASGVAGAFKPWQATIISVGAPGILLSLLLLTINEPSRKGLVQQGDNNKSQGLPMKTVLRFIWVRKRVYLSLFFGSSMMAMAGYGGFAWYPEFLHRNYGMSKSDIGVQYGT
ncbi:MAG: hypothetical protein AAF512_25070, partial [Pseudomonadota bacterium]